jgi:hypothetical protein
VDRKDIQRQSEAARRAAGRGTMLQALRKWDLFSIRSLDFFNRSNTSCRTTVLGSTQPIIEMSTRNLFEGKGRPERKADNLAAICEPNV